jgi:hypothetical protein
MVVKGRKEVRLTTRETQTSNPLRTDDVEYCNSGIFRMSVHQGAVKGDRGRCQVFENVGVVETVWVCEGGVFSGCRREGKTGCVLGDTVDESMVRKVDVDGKRFQS